MLKRPLRPGIRISALLAGLLFCAPPAFAGGGEEGKPKLQPTTSLDEQPAKDEAAVVKKDDEATVDPYFAEAQEKLKPDASGAADSGPNQEAIDKIVGSFAPFFWGPPAPNDDKRVRTDKPSTPSKELIDTIVEADQSIKEAPKDDPAAKEAIAEQGIARIKEQLKKDAPPDIPQPVYDRVLTEVSDALIRLSANPAVPQTKREEHYRDSLNMTDRVVASADKGGDNYRDALNIRAQSNLGLGRYQPAIDDATTASRLNKDDERAYTTRALAYYQMQNYNQAMEDAQRALRLNPNNETAFKIGKLSRNRLTTPKDLKLDRMARAAADQIDREYETMEEERSDSERVPPKTARAPAGRSDRVVDSLNTQALSHTKSGNHQAAYDAYTKALARDPKNTEALQRRGSASSIMGDYDKAIDDAGAILEDDPDNAEALLMRSRALTQRGRFDEAKRDADRLVGLTPQSAAAYKARGRAEENLGNVPGMIEDFRKAASLDAGVREELRVTARRYGFNLDGGENVPAASRASAESGAQDARADAKALQNRRFLIVLGSSISGGLLIAFGAVQLFLSGRRDRKRRVSVIQNAGEDTKRALAAGGELEGGFKILRVLGNGGMGIVYEAQDKALDRKVAIKKMREEIQADERERARFLQEARLVAKMHHPNIVDIHSIVEDEGELYLVFEHVEGETLDQVMNRKKRLSVKEAQYILRGVCHALEYAHHKAVIHRDLKPSNIMITTEGRVKVMDFGIARQAKDALLKSTKTNHVAGTPQYMAPEQEEGTVRTESDIFSLGACLYELVTGERPFNGPSTTASKINKRYTRASRVRQELPAELDKLIDDALEPDPDKRIRTVVEFRARLDAIAVAESKAV